MKIDGSCHCGHIAYEAEVDPAKVTLCHCTDCQILTGTAFRWTVPATRENFRLLRGEPKVYIKTAESGNRRAQAFCPECGTPIYASTATDRQVFGIRAGTARQREQLLPKKQIWCRSAQQWAMAAGSVRPQEPMQG
jgi:hypothetical protein